MVGVMESINAEMNQSCVDSPFDCWCGGSGWVLSDWDTFHECPHHYNGQPNNDSPEWEWELWTNMHGDNQFLVIPDDRHEEEISGSWWEWKANNLRLNEEDLPF